MKTILLVFVAAHAIAAMLLSAALISGLAPSVNTWAPEVYMALAALFAIAAGVWAIAEKKDGRRAE